MNAFDETMSRRARHYSAPTLAAGSRNVVLYSQGSGPFAPTHSFSKVTDEASGIESSVLHVKGMPVFRSGSFKDSMGELSTWETIHVDQMVSSFDFLRQQQIFNDVPVREGHGSFFGDPMTGLVGYHEAVYTQDAQAPDGETYRFLLADFSLNKPEAQQAYLNGLWRNRSSEVGYYESNNGTGYYPVYQGFAFVDIPAVQFLNLFGQEKKRSFSILLEKEIPTVPETPEQKAAREANEAAAQTAAAAAAAAAVQSHGAGAPGAPAPASHTFTIGGKPVADFGAVQAHITKLEADSATFEQFRAETQRSGRIAYITKLAADRKILAAQVGDSEAGKESGLIAVALGLSDEAFSAFSKTFDDLPVNPLFAATPKAGETDPTGDVSDDEKAYAAAKEKVQWHRSGHTMPEAEIRTTNSYKEYERLHAKLGKTEAL